MSIREQLAHDDLGIVDGCGSFEVSWLRCEGEAFAVSGVVDAFVFAAEVVSPVGVEVAAGDQGAELEDGFSAFEAPSRACYVHSVLDDVPARALDDTGCDGPALAQSGGVVQVAGLVVQVAGALVGACARGGGSRPRPGGRCRAGSCGPGQRPIPRRRARLCRRRTRWLSTGIPGRG